MVTTALCSDEKWPLGRHLGPDSPTCVTSASSFTGRIHSTSNSWQHSSNTSPCLAQQSLKMEYSCSTVPCHAGWSTYTRYWMCHISLENQHTKWKLISPKIVTLLLYFFFICFPTAVTKHILTEAKGIISQSTFGCKEAVLNVHQKQEYYNALPTWESIRRQMDPPLACLHHISGKHHIFGMESWWLGDLLFKKSNSVCGKYLSCGHASHPLCWLAAKFKVFSVYPISMIYWHGEMF